MKAALHHIYLLLSVDTIILICFNDRKLQTRHRQGIYLRYVAHFICKVFDTLFAYFTYVRYIGGVKKERNNDIKKSNLKCVRSIKIK